MWHLQNQNQNYPNGLNNCCDGCERCCPSPMMPAELKSWNSTTPITLASSAFGTSRSLDGATCGRSIDTTTPPASGSALSVWHNCDQTLPCSDWEAQQLLSKLSTGAWLEISRGNCKSSTSSSLRTIGSQGFPAPTRRSIHRADIISRTVYLAFACWLVIFKGLSVKWQAIAIFMPMPERSSIELLTTNSKNINTIKPGRKL